MFSIAQSFSEKFNAFPLVKDSITITVGNLPLQMKDEVLVQYLSKFGEVDEAEAVIWKKHPKYGTYLCQRVYTLKTLQKDIPSFTWIHGRRLRIKYRGQPHTCMWCDCRMELPSS